MKQEVAANSQFFKSVLERCLRSRGGWQKIHEEVGPTPSRRAFEEITEVRQLLEPKLEGHPLDRLAGNQQSPGVLKSQLVDSMLRGESKQLCEMPPQVMPADADFQRQVAGMITGCPGPVFPVRYSIQAASHAQNDSVNCCH